MSHFDFVLVSGWETQPLRLGDLTLPFFCPLYPHIALLDLCPNTTVDQTDQYPFPQLDPLQ